MKQTVEIKQGGRAGLLHHISNLVARLRCIDHDKQILVHPTCTLTATHNAPACVEIKDCDFTDYFDMSNITRTDENGVVTSVELAPIGTSPDITIVSDNGLTRKCWACKDKKSTDKFQIPLAANLQKISDLVQERYGRYNCMHLRCRDSIVAKNSRDFSKIERVLARCNLSKDIPLYIMTDIPDVTIFNKIKQLGYTILTYDMFKEFVDIKPKDNYKLFAIEYFGVMRAAEQQIQKHEFHPNHFKR